MSAIDVLDAKARVEEVARMLGGLEITATTRKHARELLALISPVVTDIAMAFRQEPPHHHGTAGKTAVVLVNLGTPDAPTRSAVRRYLKQFLSDPRVVEIPRGCGG